MNTNRWAPGKIEVGNLDNGWTSRSPISCKNSELDKLKEFVNLKKWDWSWSAGQRSTVLEIRRMAWIEEVCNMGPVGILQGDSRRDREEKDNAENFRTWRKTCLQKEEAYEMPNESTPNYITVKLWNIKGKEEPVKDDNPMIADFSAAIEAGKLQKRCWGKAFVQELSIQHNRFQRECEIQTSSHIWDLVYQE